MVAKEINQVIQTINADFSPLEARDMLNELITNRINYHQVQMLRKWEGDHHFDSNEWNKKMDAMIKEKTEAIALIAKAKKEDLRVEIIENIEVRLHPRF